jgi:oligopeptide transport system ATP-binding protein
MKTETPLLEVKNLKKHFYLKKGLFNTKYEVIKAIDDLSFSVPVGKTIGIVGESGCGKTTTGKCILRVYPPTSGSILYKSQNLLDLKGKHASEFRRKIQIIFQDPYGSLDPRQSVFSILKEVYIEDGKSHTRREIREKVEELLETVGLSIEISKRYPHEMSGGQRQRVGIARALACKPELIVCDEPVSALDVSIQAQIINLFIKLQREQNLTYVFIAHDIAVVRHIADTIAIMYMGQIVETMDAGNIYTNPIHPYTKALLSAIPVVDYYEEKKRARIVLEGEVPSAINRPSGCPFHTRCNYATSVCREQNPQMTDRGARHMVACHNV